MQRIKWFDGLRGLFCIWIILFHYTARYSILYDCDDILFLVTEGGKVGVLLFFVLSGFLCMMTSDKYYKESGWKWFSKKIKRLYPSFFIVCCLLFLIDNFVVGLRDSVSLTIFFKSLLLIPMYSPTIDGAHWYVFALVRYYLVFWLILRFKLQKQFIFWVSVVCIILINGSAKRVGIFNPCQYIIPEWIDSRMIQGVFLYYVVKDAEINVFDKRYLTLYCVNGLIIVLTGSAFYSIILLAGLPLLFYRKIEKIHIAVKKNTIF